MEDDGIICCGATIKVYPDGRLMVFTAEVPFPPPGDVRRLVIEDQNFRSGTSFDPATPELFILMRWVK